MELSELQAVPRWRESETGIRFRRGCAFSYRCPVDFTLKMNTISESYIAARCPLKFKQTVIQQLTRKDIRGGCCRDSVRSGGAGCALTLALLPDLPRTPRALSRPPSPQSPRDPAEDAALGMLGRLRGRAGRRASTWLARPPRAARTAPGGALQGEETARGGAARSRAAAQLFPPISSRG